MSHRIMVGAAIVLCCRAAALRANVTPAWSPTTEPADSCAGHAPADSLRAVLSDSSAPRRWTPAQRTVVRRRLVCIGMTADMMQQSWGDSGRLHVSVPPVPGDTTFQYFYNGATIVVVNSVVRAIRPPAPLPRRRR